MHRRIGLALCLILSSMTAQGLRADEPLFNTAVDVTGMYGINWWADSVDVVDLDNGGNQDLLASDSLWLRADGTGGLQTAEAITNYWGMTASKWTGPLTFADFNGDGQWDYVGRSTIACDGDSCRVWLLIAY